MIEKSLPAPSSFPESIWSVIGILIGASVASLTEHRMLGSDICFAGVLITLVISRVRKRKHSTLWLVLSVAVYAAILAIRMADRA